MTLLSNISIDTNCLSAQEDGHRGSSRTTAPYFSYIRTLSSPATNSIPTQEMGRSLHFQSDRYVPSPGLYLINTEPPKNPGLLKTKGCLNHSIEYGIMLFMAARLKFCVS